MSRDELDRDEDGLASHVAPTRMAHTTKAVQAPLPSNALAYPRARLAARRDPGGLHPDRFGRRFPTTWRMGNASFCALSRSSSAPCQWPVRSSSGQPNLRVGRVVEGKLELGDCDRHGGLTESDRTDV